MISGCTLEYLGCKTRVALETEEYQNNFLLNLADEVLKIKAPLTESWLWVQVFMMPYFCANSGAFCCPPKRELRFMRVKLPSTPR